MYARGEGIGDGMSGPKKRGRNAFCFLDDKLAMHNTGGRGSLPNLTRNLVFYMIIIIGIIVIYYFSPLHLNWFTMRETDRRKETPGPDSLGGVFLMDPMASRGFLF